MDFTFKVFYPVVCNFQLLFQHGDSRNQGVMLPDFSCQFVQLGIGDGLRFTVSDENTSQGDNSSNYGGYHFIHILTPPSITVKAESAVEVVSDFIINIEQNNGPFCFNHLLGGRDADVARFAVLMCHGDGGVLLSRLK